MFNKLWNATGFRRHDWHTTGKRLGDGQP